MQTGSEKEEMFSKKMLRRDPSLPQRNNEPFILGRTLAQNLISGISDIMGDGGLSPPLSSSLPLSLAPSASQCHSH